MRNINSIVLASGICLALLGSAVHAAEAKKPDSAAAGKPEAMRESSKSPAVTAPPQSFRPVQAELPAEVKDLINKFTVARDQFLDSQKKLDQEYLNSSKEGRERVRALITEARQKFLDQQKTAREEIRKRLTELKATLKDHGDIIDQAKEQVKEQVKQRKGGSE